jgi:hypothetical protein
VTLINFCNFSENTIKRVFETGNRSIPVKSELAAPGGVKIETAIPDERSRGK